MPKPDKWFTLYIDLDGPEFQGGALANGIIEILETTAAMISVENQSGHCADNQARWHLNTPGTEIDKPTSDGLFAVYINCDGAEFAGDLFVPELKRSVRSMIGQIATGRWNGALMRHYSPIYTYGNWKTVIGPNYITRPPRKATPRKVKSPRIRAKP